MKGRTVSASSWSASPRPETPPLAIANRSITRQITAAAAKARRIRLARPDKGRPRVWAPGSSNTPRNRTATKAMMRPARIWPTLPPGRKQSDDRVHHIAIGGRWRGLVLAVWVRGTTQRIGGRTGPVLGEARIRQWDPLALH